MTTLSDPGWILHSSWKDHLYTQDPCRFVSDHCNADGGFRLFHHRYCQDLVQERSTISHGNLTHSSQDPGEKYSNTDRINHFKSGQDCARKHLTLLVRSSLPILQWSCLRLWMKPGRICLHSVGRGSYAVSEKSWEESWMIWIKFVRQKLSGLRTGSWSNHTRILSSKDPHWSFQVILRTDQEWD